jgi:hypothetical protein
MILLPKRVSWIWKDEACAVATLLVPEPVKVMFVFALYTHKLKLLLSLNLNMMHDSQHKLLN